MRMLALVIAMTAITPHAHAAGWCETENARKCIDILANRGLNPGCDNSLGPGKEITVPVSKIPITKAIIRHSCPKVSAANSQ